MRPNIENLQSNTLKVMIFKSKLLFEIIRLILVFQSIKELTSEVESGS